MSDFAWGSPIAFWALPLAALVMALVLGLRRVRRARLDRFIGAKARAGMTQKNFREMNGLRGTLAVLGVLLCALALARPQWGYTWIDVQRRGLEIVFLLDTSRSMQANDIPPNRLQRAKWGIEEFLRELDGDRVGLVGFAGSAQILCPMTLDYGAFRMHLDDVFPGIIPRGGTNLAAGLRMAAQAFGDEPGEADRVVILITDGENHEGDAEVAARELLAQGIRVFAIGIGSPEGGLIPLPMDAGGPHLKNRQGEVVMSALDESSLLRITRLTNGLYHRATAADFGVTHLIEQGLAPLKRAQLETSRIRQMNERFQIPLGLGLLLLFLEGFARVPSLWKRKEPK